MISASSSSSSLSSSSSSSPPSSSSSSSCLLLLLLLFVALVVGCIFCFLLPFRTSMPRPTKSPANAWNLVHRNHGELQDGRLEVKIPKKYRGKLMLEKKSEIPVFFFFFVGSILPSIYFFRHAVSWGCCSPQARDTYAGERRSSYRGDIPDYIFWVLACSLVSKIQKIYHFGLL